MFRYIDVRSTCVQDGRHDSLFARKEVYCNPGYRCRPCRCCCTGDPFGPVHSSPSPRITTNQRYKVDQLKVKCRPNTGNMSTKLLVTCNSIVPTNHW